MRKNRKSWQLCTQPTNKFIGKKNKEERNKHIESPVAIDLDLIL